MRFAISYFYQIRFFKPYMIPVSTALWDPAWYHNFLGHEHTFVDKNGVVNGLRCEEMHISVENKDLCEGNLCETKDPTNCIFLKEYKKDLDKIDFNEFIARAERSGNNIKAKLGFSEEPIIVLIVHEAPWKACSERPALVQYFKEHGVELPELNPKK